MYYQFSNFLLDFFSIVAIIGWVLVLFKMRAVEVIHSLMWDIRIVVFTPIFLCEACGPTSNLITNFTQHDC